MGPDARQPAYLHCGIIVELRGSIPPGHHKPQTDVNALVFELQIISRHIILYLLCKCSAIHYSCHGFFLHSNHHCLAGTLVSLGPLLTQESPILPLNTASWVGVAAVAIFSIIGQLSINHALTRIPASRVSVVMTAEVPLVACFGVLYLGEPIGWRLIVGTALIFGSGIGLNLLPVRSTPD